MVAGIGAGLKRLIAIRLNQIFGRIQPGAPTTTVI